MPAPQQPGTSKELQQTQPQSSTAAVTHHQPQPLILQKMVSEPAEVLQVLPAHEMSALHVWGSCSKPEPVCLISSGNCMTAGASQPWAAPGCRYHLQLTWGISSQQLLSRLYMRVSSHCAPVLPVQSHEETLLMGAHLLQSARAAMHLRDQAHRLFALGLSNLISPATHPQPRTAKDLANDRPLGPDGSFVQVSCDKNRYLAIHRRY